MALNRDLVVLYNEIEYKPSLRGTLREFLSFLPRSLPNHFSSFLARKSQKLLYRSILKIQNKN